MVLPTKKSADCIIVEPGQVDLSRAVYSEELSSTELDADAKSFHVTLDRVVFMRPLSIVTAVLDANGFAVNMENLLACFDELSFAAKVILSEKKQSQALPTVKSFLPCLQFNLPSKSKIGPLLKKFYAEIESYEQEIARLTDGDSDRKGEKSKSREQLKKELDIISQETQRLKAQIADLSSQLAQSAKSQSNSAKALISQNIVPPQLRLATVREISLYDRNVVMKSGRTNISVPLGMLSGLPQQGDACVLHIVEGRVLGAFLYETAGEPWAADLADVVFAKERFCKVRDTKRAMHILEAKNDYEAELLANLRRGSKVVLYSIEGVVIRFQAVRKNLSTIYARRVQEKIAVFQLEKLVKKRMEDRLGKGSGQTED